MIVQDYGGLTLRISHGQSPFIRVPSSTAQMPRNATPCFPQQLTDVRISPVWESQGTHTGIVCDQESCHERRQSELG